MRVNLKRWEWARIADIMLGYSATPGGNYREWAEATVRSIGDQVSKYCRERNARRAARRAAK